MVVGKRKSYGKNCYGCNVYVFSPHTTCDKCLRASLAASQERVEKLIGWGFCSECDEMWYTNDGKCHLCRDPRSFRVFPRSDFPGGFSRRYRAVSKDGSPIAIPGLL